MEKLRVTDEKVSWMSEFKGNKATREHRDKGMKRESRGGYNSK